VDPAEAKVLLLAVGDWDGLAFHPFAGRFAFEILCQAAVFVKYQARISRGFGCSAACKNQYGQHDQYNS
jgi:hypothetical protein